MKKGVTAIIFILLFVTLMTNFAAAEDYHLAPGDSISIGVWGYQELNIPELVIRPDGKISLPLAGEVQASGLTVAQLTAAMTAGLGNYVKNPQVMINLVKIHTIRVYVLGEVVKPGLYELEKGHNLLDAIGIANGFTKDAAKKKVAIIHSNGKGERINVNVLNLLTKGDMSQNYALNEGDIVYISQNGRLDFAHDILPFLTGAYYIRYAENSN